MEMKIKLLQRMMKETKNEENYIDHSGEKT
jgi:hypothetical protein